MRVLLLLAALLAAATAERPASAQEAGPHMTEEALDGQRGGLATPFGVDIGFGASVKTYVDGALALETRLTWTPDGARTDRVFSAAAAEGLPPGVGGLIEIAPGTSVLHDLGDSRIASVVLNTASDRSIRQDTDLTLHLPQLPDLQQRISTERLTQALSAISPQAAGLR